MIVVTIELWKKGDEENKVLLGQIGIANDASGTSAIGNYKAVLSKKGTGQTWKEVEIADFPRKRLGAYDLLFRVLQRAVGYRNGQ